MELLGHHRCFCTQLPFLDNARTFAQSQDLREAMQRAGVADQPDIYFFEEVEELRA